MKCCTCIGDCDCPIDTRLRDEDAVGLPCSSLPIPTALYPCAHCYEEYSWPAQDLIWCPETQEWVCVECWDYEIHGDTKGTALADEIQRQNDQAQP